MEKVRVFVDTDWWMFLSTILSGIIAATATLVAVIVSNRETRRQLLQQQNRYEKEQEEKNKKDKFVIIKPTIILSSFMGILDKLIIQNDYNRELLFTGEDGFDFFDDIEKRQNQTCRILHISNSSPHDIMDVVLTTESCLENKDTNEKMRYKTKNAIKLLRSMESIDIRLTNQMQYEKILYMNKKKVPSKFDFNCYIEYSTEAMQRIVYHYKIIITNDKGIEIEKDEIEQVIDETMATIETTAFRNLQDYISNIDRSAYAWEKMGQSQVRGMMTLINPTSTQQSAIEKKSEVNNRENNK